MDPPMNTMKHLIPAAVASLLACVTSHPATAQTLVQYSSVSATAAQILGYTPSGGNPTGAALLYNYTA